MILLSQELLTLLNFLPFLVSNMRAELVISSIIRNLDYRSVEEGSEVWKRVEQNLDAVLEQFRNAGYFRNLQRKSVALEKVLDSPLLDSFAPHTEVYRLPVNFGSLDSKLDGLYVKHVGNWYYLINDGACGFSGYIDYTIHINHDDFSWCDPTILNSIIAEVVFRIKAIDSGQGLGYFSQVAAKNLAYARQVKTKRDLPRNFSGW